jgi:hypothetical protein
VSIGRACVVNAGTWELLKWWFVASLDWLDIGCTRSYFGGSLRVRSSESHGALGVLGTFGKVAIQNLKLLL